MSEQPDLAAAAAIILSFHLSEIQNLDRLGVSLGKTTRPDLLAGRRIWAALQPFIGASAALRQAAAGLASEPSPASRHALEEQLRQALKFEDALRAEIEEIVRQSPYAHLIGEQAVTVHSAPRDPQPNRELWLWLLAVVYILAFGAAALFSGRRQLLGETLVFVIRAPLVGYYASRLRIRRGWWLALAGVLPGTALPTLLAVAGFRPEEPGGSGRAAYYTTSTRYALAIPVVAPLLLALFLTVTSPQYMAQFFDFPVGVVLLLVTLLLLAALGGAVWLGIWRGRATTGIHIALVAIIVGWCTLLALWLVLLGPATVQVTKVFPAFLPHLLRGDFSVLDRAP